MGSAWADSMKYGKLGTGVVGTGEVGVMVWVGGEGVEGAAELVGWRDGILAIGGVAGFGGCGAGADRGGSGASVV